MENGADQLRIAGAQRESVTGEGDELDPGEERRSAEGDHVDADRRCGRGLERSERRTLIRPEEGKLPADDRTAAEIAESVTKGRELFYGTKANCVKCHGPTALGDGQQDDYDIWSKATKKFEDDTAMLPAIDQVAERSDGEPAGGRARGIAKASWRQEQGTIGARGRDRAVAAAAECDSAQSAGRRFPRRSSAVGYFHRVNRGISGTPMPGGGPASAGAQGTLSEEEIWQIVDYVQSLPFEPASRAAEPDRCSSMPS